MIKDNSVKQKKVSTNSISPAVLEVKQPFVPLSSKKVNQKVSLGIFEQNNLKLKDSLSVKLTFGEQFKFVTKLMHKGKKEKAEQLLIKALKKVEQELVKKQGLVSDSIESTKVLLLGKILDQVISNAKPLVRLKKVRIAGATHQKPIALTKKQAETDAIKRIITNANARSEKSIVLKLAKEFEEIYLNILSNKTLTEIRDLHKLAELNKANVTLKS